MGLQAAKEVKDGFLFNSSTTDERIATQRSSTEVTKAGNQQKPPSLINKNKSCGY
jgi:hypothetical protein